MNVHVYIYAHMYIYIFVFTYILLFLEISDTHLIRDATLQGHVGKKPAAESTSQNVPAHKASQLYQHKGMH